MNTKIGLCMGCLLMTTGAVRAQQKIGAELKAEYIPFSNYVRPEDSATTGSTSDMKQMEMALMVPFSFKRRTADEPASWYFVMGCSYARITNRNYDKAIFPDEMLNVQIGLKHTIPLGRNWSVFAMATAGIYSDLTRIDGNDVLFQGGALFVKQFNTHLTAGLGPVVSNAFGVPMVMPGLFFNWTTGGRFKVNVSFPEKAEIGYVFHEAFTLKAVIATGGMTVETERKEKSVLLGYRQIVAGLMPSFRLGGAWTLELTAGSTLLRSFRESERTLKGLFSSRDQADPHFKPTFYGALSLKLNMP